MHAARTGYRKAQDERFNFLEQENKRLKEENTKLREENQKLKDCLEALRKT